MADKEKAKTTIRIYGSTKDKLKELKFGNEGDAVVIARLIEENHELKEEKKKLYELLSIVNVPKVRVNTFAQIIKNVINGSNISLNKCCSKLEVLKDIFNSDILIVEPVEVKEAIEIVKNDYDKNNIPPALADFEVYVNGNH